MNKWLGVITICLSASFFAAGCAHQNASLSETSENVAKAESDHGSLVCLLDPALDAAKKAEPVAASRDGRSPAVEITETSFDFGKVGDAQELVHTFNVRNVGTSVLSIRKVVPG